MSILIIWSSPNTDGLTAAVKDQILSGISSGGADAEVIHLNGRDIKNCIICGDGWGICRSDGSCVIDDDFEDIYRKIVSSDGVVWVTAVYWHDVAENMKAFLDRLRRCEAACNHMLKGKRNLIVACAGDTGNGAVQCLDKLETTLNHMDMIALDRLPVIQFNKSYMLPACGKAGQAFAVSCN